MPLKCFQKNQITMETQEERPADLLSFMFTTCALPVPSLLMKKLNYLCVGNYKALLKLYKTFS